MTTERIQEVLEDEKTIAEIGQELGLSRRAVRLSLRVAMAALGKTGEKNGHQAALAHTRAAKQRLH